MPSQAQHLLPQRISEDVISEKYCKSGERSAEDIFRRVARALASVEAEGQREHWEQRFLENLRAGGYVDGCRKIDLSAQFARARGLMGL